MQTTTDIPMRGRWLEDTTLRMLGSNVTFSRSQWVELLESLRPESELAQRIRAHLLES